MSGPTATDRLRSRFDAVRESELERLSRKLSTLAADHRRCVEAVAAEVIRALALVPERAVNGGARPEDVAMLARLFRLDD